MRFPNDIHRHIAITAFKHVQNRCTNPLRFPASAPMDARMYLPVERVMNGSSSDI
jgi:hypothetical protein